MDYLKAIIATFSTKEKLQFITYLKKKNKRKDSKNITLFKLLEKNELDSKAIHTQLYGTKSKDALHALRKRLYHSLIDFTANLNLENENSIEMQVIKYILAAKTFFLRKQYILAYKTLDKAEALAYDYYLFALQNEIYHTKIQYAYTNSNIDLEKLIIQFKQNQKKYFLEDQLNIAYAKIRQAISSNKNANIDHLLKTTLTEYNINTNDFLSFKSLYQLVTIISISAFTSKDYLKIEPFLIKTYQALKTHKSKEKQLFYHIQVIFLIANTLFRNKKFKDSFLFLNEMEKHMSFQKNKFYNTFKLKHGLLTALNYNFSNHQKKAITHLERLYTLKHEDKESLLNINLSLIMFYIQAENLKKAYTLFSKFYHTSNYYKKRVSKEWLIKKDIIEIILNIELGNIDLVESRLLSFKRNHSSFLKSINQKRVITYINFVEKYYKHPEKINSDRFFNDVENAFEWVEAKREDIFVMSYYAWLKSKMEKKPLYEVTINLIKQASSLN